MRGIYTAGVLDVLGEHGISFDGVVGVSAGAIHASSFLSGQHGRSIRFYLAFCRDPRFMGLRSWMKSGDFVSFPFCYETIPQQIVPFDFDALEASPSAFFITCTDVETGQPYYHRTHTIRGHEIQVLRASASLPFVSKIVTFDGRKLLDGSTADSIPLAFLKKEGFNRNVVILTRVAGYRKTPEKLSLARVLYRRFPAYIEAMRTRHERYNQSLDDIETQEKAGELFVFRPSKTLNIRRLDRSPSKILEMYELGREDAIKRLDDLKHYLQKPEKE